ncbi:MAG TPA: response regulator [Acidimicrobiales bacterium]|nr:response regulator [Acidimicrobiales bacterium]
MAHRNKAEGWDGADRRDPASVLVVNEDAAARELLVRFLGQAGFTVSGASGDKDALARMTEELPRCVVLDMQAGGVGSSLKVLDQIRTHHDRRINTARVVLCAPGRTNRGFSFQSGADAFLVRPYHLNDLIEHVTDVITRPQDDRARHRRDELTKHE